MSTRRAFAVLCFACLVFAAPVAADAAGVPVVEYFDAHLGRLFYTADAAEIARLDAGAANGWVRSPAPAGGGFDAWASAGTAPADAVPVCRFYWPRQELHFFTAFASECGALLAAGGPWLLESAAAFYVLLPDAASGACSDATAPVYRLYAAPEHALTASLELRALGIARGNAVPEGFGDMGVAFCTPPRRAAG